MDSIDAKIIALIEKDPEMSYRAMGKRLGMSHQAVANRLRDMVIARVVDYLPATKGRWTVAAK